MREMDGPDGDVLPMDVPASDSELEMEEEAEWRRLRTPSPEPRNRSYELPEAFCVKSVLLATEPAAPCLPSQILQSQREMAMPLKDPSSPTLGNVAGSSPSFTSATWRGLGQMPSVGQQAMLVVGLDESKAKSKGSSSSKDGPFSDTWPPVAASPIASGMTSRKTTASSFTQVEFFPEDVPFYQASMDAVSGIVTITGVETMRPSRGSEGHPHNCQAACKYVRKARGCKDGDNCAHCHLCIWKSSTKQTAKCRCGKVARPLSLPLT